MTKAQQSKAARDEVGMAEDREVSAESRAAFDAAKANEAAKVEALGFNPYAVRLVPILDGYTRCRIN